MGRLLWIGDPKDPILWIEVRASGSGITEMLRKCNVNRKKYNMMMMIKMQIKMISRLTTFTIIYLLYQKCKFCNDGCRMKYVNKNIKPPSAKIKFNSVYIQVLVESYYSYFVWYLKSVLILNVDRIFDNGTILYTEIESI